MNQGWGWRERTDGDGLSSTILLNVVTTSTTQAEKRCWCRWYAIHGRATQLLRTDWRKGSIIQRKPISENITMGNKTRAGMNFDAPKTASVARTRSRLTIRNDLQQCIRVAIEYKAKDAQLHYERRTEDVWTHSSRAKINGEKTIK